VRRCRDLDGESCGHCVEYACRGADDFRTYPVAGEENDC